MANEPKQPVDFYAIASIVMGAFVGLLIAIPITVSTTSRAVAGATLLGLPLLGLLSGYRRRHSRIFFYLCLIAIVVLSTILTMNAPQQ